MIRLLLIRHGETDWNVQHRYQGQTDVPLNDVGQRQAAALARRLAKIEISAVYASDLQRAQQTARAIASPHRIPAQDDPRLREMSFGEWEGRTHAEIEARWPDEMAAWFADPAGVAPPGGETLAQVAERVQSVLDDVVLSGADRTIVVVAHGGSLSVFLCAAMGLDPGAHWRFGIDVASLSELRIYGQDTMLAKLNDTHHVARDDD